MVVLAAGFSLSLDRQARRVAEERDRAEEVLDFLVGLFGSASPVVARGEATTVRDVLDRGAVRVRTSLSDQPIVQATLMQAIGDVYRSLGLRDSALALYDEALDLRRRRGPNDDPSHLALLTSLGLVYTEVGNPGAAEPLLEEALELARSGDLAGTPRAAAAFNTIGYAWQVRGDLDRSEPLLIESLATFEALAEPTMEMALPLTNLGWLAISRGEPERAASFFRRSVALRRDLDPEHPALANSLVSLAGALLRMNAYDAADSAATEALEIRRRVLLPGDDRIAGALSMRARVLHARGQSADAVALWREVLGMQVERLGEDHQVVANTQNSLALLFQDMGRLDEAATLMRQSWRTFADVFGDDHVNPTIVEINLARSAVRYG